MRLLLSLLAICFGATLMGAQLDWMSDWEQFWFFLGLGFVCLGWERLDR